MTKEKQIDFDNLNQSKWMRYEDDIIKYYYPMLKEWLDKGMIKPANIQFTSGLGRDIARLMEDVRKKEKATEEFAEKIDKMIDKFKLTLTKSEGYESDGTIVKLYDMSEKDFNKLKQKIKSEIIEDGK